MGCRAVAAAACVAVASLVAAPAPASPRVGLATCAQGYRYAGYAGRDGSDDVSATIAALSRPSVATGHAAAWVGVGGIHAGRGNASEWLQAGLAAFPRLGLRLYVEEVSRGQARRFVDLGPAVVGRRYRIRVRETGLDVWRAFVEGAAVDHPDRDPFGRDAAASRAPDSSLWRGAPASMILPSRAATSFRAGGGARRGAHRGPHQARPLRLLG